MTPVAEMRAWREELRESRGDPSGARKRAARIRLTANRLTNLAIERPDAADFLLESIERQLKRYTEPNKRAGAR
jgi:hypothetical protein